MHKLKPIFLVAVPILLSSCVINHKRQDYSTIKGGTSLSGAITKSEYAAQIIATDYSKGGGLTLDLRAPYSIHIRIISKKPYDSLIISNLKLRLGNRQQVIVTNVEPIKSRSLKNDYGLYIARIDLPDCFDWTPEGSEELLHIDVDGAILRKGSHLPFQVKSKFVFKESRLLRLFTLEDAISI